MKITIITGTINCIPLLQFLVLNKIQITIYHGFSLQNNTDYDVVKNFCVINNIGWVDENVTITEYLNQLDHEFAFVFGYKELINIDLLSEKLKQRIFNIHFGSLPDYKGPNPVFWQLKNGESKVGIAIHHLSKKFDEGPVVWMKKIPNEEHFSYGYIEMIFSQLIIEGITFIINCVMNKQKLVELSDDALRPKYYKRPEFKDVLINWCLMTANEIVNLTKACNPWNKGASTFFHGNELKIVYIEKADNVFHSEQTPGTIIDTDDFTVICINNEVIRVIFFNFNGIFMPGKFISKIGVKKGDRLEVNNLNG